MQQQGHNEATGLAKITRAYNLPSNYVIHTVGPIVEATVNETHQSLLTSSYTSILNLAAEIETLKSLAFCSISTGVFGYPIEQATPLAIETVKDWLINHPGQFDSIIFNVFSEHDLHVYQSVMNAQS
jgi:O-acetyl-ADP-ribose deacetylase (regulator of RNase III)